MEEMINNNIENLEDRVDTEIVESSISEEAIEAVETVSTSENRIDDTTEKKVDAAIENAKWYVLHTFSGYENVAKENLEIVTEKYNLQERIFDIVIPMEDVVEEKNGKKKIVSRKVMPGYIMVKMIYGDDIWHAVTRTRGITGFVGPKGRPLHLTEEEIRKMRLEKNTVVDITITENDKVEVLDGALNGFVGTVLSVDRENAKCRVMVEMFGRDTPVDLNLDQIRKVD
jgi:transcriptional antiterminator NusG